MSKTVEETPQDNKTKAGNYFISNYPPYSFWTPDHVPEATAALNRAPRPDTPLGIYLHIPFCRKRCHFCYFRVYTGVNSKQVRSYVDGAIKELELYAGQPFIGGRKPTRGWSDRNTDHVGISRLRHLSAALSVSGWFCSMRSTPGPDAL